MVLQICIACGRKVPLRVRSCSCGHVMAENVILINPRLRRNGEKRMRKVTLKIKERKQTNSKTIEARQFYLGQANKLKLAEKGVTKPRLRSTSPPSYESEKKREKELLLYEEKSRKIEKIISSPQYQQRMRKALYEINTKLLRQQTFLKLISMKKTKRRKCRFF